MNFVRFTLVTAAVVDLLACTYIRTAYNETQQGIRNLNAVPMDVNESAITRVSNGRRINDARDDAASRGP
ncbi:hypothetical protein Plhal710r2_c033g0122061 [Plasmopara halstedii]